MLCTLAAQLNHPELPHTARSVLWETAGRTVDRQGSPSGDKGGSASSPTRTYLRACPARSLPQYRPNYGVNSLKKNRWTGTLLQGVLLGVGVWLLLTYRTEFPFVQVWVPPWAWREASYPIALAAFVLLATGLLPPSHLRKYVPDSPLFGVILWSLTHLLTNGDLASILFFGSVAGLAGMKIFLRRRKSGWGLAPNKQNIDSGNLLTISKVSVQWDIAAILLGMVVWGIVVLFHGQLFGVGLDLTGY